VANTFQVDDKAALTSQLCNSKNQGKFLTKKWAHLWMPFLD